MKSRFKLLLLIDEATIGGGQQHVLWLAQELTKRKYKVAVACGRTGYLAERLAINRIQHLSISIPKGFSFKGLLSVLTAIKIFKPKLLHTHGGFAGFYGRIAGMLCNIPVMVHTFHGIHYVHYQNQIKRIFLRFIDRILLRVTDATICVSRDDANIALSNRIGRPESNFVIPNAINVTRFSKVVKQKRKNRNKNKYVVGTIGRLDVPKGHTYFLKAAAHVLSRLSKVEFQIIGDGHLRSELEKECHQLGIESNVKFLGTRYDIPEILSTWNVFVLPSLWEGMPLVILEAMAARCPVIATAVNGVNEILQDQKDALIVPIKNDYALADGILRLLMDSKLAASLARTAYKKVITNSSINNMVDKIEDVYRFVLQGRD